MMKRQLTNIYKIEFDGAFFVIAHEKGEYWPIDGELLTMFENRSKLAKDVSKPPAESEFHREFSRYYNDEDYPEDDGEQDYEIPSGNYPPVITGAFPFLEEQKSGLWLKYKEWEDGLVKPLLLTVKLHRSIEEIYRDISRD